MQQLQIPPLADGEIYLIGLVDANGDVEHTILLPGDNDDASQAEQLAWAQSIGGDLPNRIEQAVMLAKFRDRFQKDAYWSNETCDWNSSCAWFQGFGGGGQDGTHKCAALRAVAVRRFKN
ncbi:DUF1566 domain-containing protein [Paraburkholderia bryophila]|uniref:Uncharacterized protein with beta-barrel porin domain n=1 Tax=Paraburkholderia bryophila TaxID=420952 RepID=A0A7Y9WJI0_9BURK|nr:DUF1566 domain-containing protein [Paraburkholderia bryophila]NYH21420.1 uncharacterized protein with beta-barrel porin domain [Paraburkholderia bryophila]